MINFESSNIEDLQLETDMRSLEVGVNICTEVCRALEEDVDSVVVGYIPKLDMELLVHREGYLDSLQMNLHRCEEAEEFELCKKVSEWIKKLTNENI